MKQQHAWLMALCLGLTATMTQAAVKEYEFENGLKLIVKEDHRAPIAVTQVWYKVGSSYEPTGLTGISHALEHMMFKGTDKYGPGEFSRIISENGGRDNAFTGRDYTAYFQTLEKSRLPISFELEADRMRHLNLLEQEFSKEIQVVKEERRWRTDDKPQAYAYETAMATAFQTSPYRNPVVGWMSDLETMKIEDLADWYQQWYAPNNATVVVVGDVVPDEVYELAKKYFAPLKAEKISQPLDQPEVPQLGEKRVVIKRPAEIPYLMMAYKTPVIASSMKDPATTPEADIYALEVLAGILDGGKSARFAKHLVRDQQIAASVSAGYSLASRLDSLFTISGTPAQGKTVEELEQAIVKEIEDLKNNPVSADELDRVKAQVVSADVYEKDSIFYQAMIIGTLETVGLDWKMADEYVEKIKAVTAEQIQAVVNKYFISDGLTVATLDPQPINPNQQRRRPLGGMRHAN